MNSVDQQTKKNEGENKYFQISPESIEMIAETVGYSNIPSSVSKSLAEDTSYRLRELIQVILFIISHASFAIQLILSLSELCSNFTPQQTT